MTHLDTTRHLSTLPRRPGFGIAGMLALWRQRRQLNALDDRALADIGLSRAEALREARRVAWDVPDTWRA